MLPLFFYNATVFCKGLSVLHFTRVLSGKRNKAELSGIAVKDCAWTINDIYSIPSPFAIAALLVIFCAVIEPRNLKQSLFAISPARSTEVAIYVINCASRALLRTYPTTSVACRYLLQSWISGTVEVPIAATSKTPSICGKIAMTPSR
jgi:hypothetical protein